ncbi:MAG: ABC transporter substrate-binding protein [Oscillospiraceae bacterium]
MKQRLLSRGVALAICATLLLTGCGQAKPTTADTVAYQTELDIAIPANPPSLDPHGINSNAVGGIGIHLYEPLFTLNADYQPTPVLAETYTVSDDGLTYTILLRHGVKFHNGQEMTADDVVASMNLWLERCSKAVLIAGAVFTKVEDYTVTLTVPEASADIIQVLAAPIQFAAIYPASVAEAAGAEGVTEYIGTGPYQLAEWKQDQYVKLTRFADYQSPTGESSGLAGEKKAATETIYFRVVTDENTRIAGVQTGQYDIMEEIPLEQYASLSAGKDLNLVTEAGGTLNLFFNTTKGPLANPTLRQAVLAALHCDDVLLASFGDPGLYVLNPGWCNPDDSLWGSDAGGAYYNQNNPEKAKQLMTEAGYQNEKIVLVTTPDYSEMYNATLVVQEQLRQAGFHAEVESYDFSTFMERRANPNQFDLFITSNSYNPLPIQLSVLSAPWAGLDAPQVAAGIHDIRAAATPEDASAAWQTLQLFLYEDGAATVLGHYTTVNALGTGVEGYAFLRYPIYWNVTVAE